MVLRFLRLFLVLCALHDGAAGQDTLWIPAEDGLWMTDAEAEARDRVRLEDDVLAGRPLGVVVDRGGQRVWVATEQEFGCFDSRFFFGRVLRPADGIPPPPYTGLTRVEGGLRIRNRAGTTVVYRPDRGAPPEVTRVQARLVGGRTVRIRVEGRATGGPTFRYRAAHRHAWLPIRGREVEIAGVDPGRAVFEVVAVDRDLRYSAPRRVAVDVPYPEAFDKRLLVPAVGGASLGLLALLVWRSRRGGARALWRAAISAGLIVVLALQVAAGLLGYGRSWPFVGFSMYTERYHEGSVLYKPVIEGRFADGVWRELHPSAFGLPSDGPWQAVVRLLHGGDSERRRCVEAYERAHGVVLQALRVRTRRIRLTRDGPVRIAAVVLLRYEPERDGR